MDIDKWPSCQERAAFGCLKAGSRYRLYRTLMKNCFKDGKLKNVLFSLALVAKCDLYVVFITCLIHSMAINDDT